MTPVTAIAGGRHGSVAVTCSSEGTLRLWDLERGGVVRTIYGDAGFSAVDTLTLCLNDSLVAITKGHCLQVRELSTGKLLYSESESLDVPMVTCASEGQLLVVFFDGSQVVKASVSRECLLSVYSSSHSPSVLSSLPP